MAFVSPLSQVLRCSQPSGAGWPHSTILVSLCQANTLCQRLDLRFHTRCLRSTTKHSSSSLSGQQTLLWVPHGEPSVPAGCFGVTLTERTPGTQRSLRQTTPPQQNIFDEGSDSTQIDDLVLMGTRKSKVQLQYLVKTHFPVHK